jgi:RNA polymerase-associated protein
VVNGALKLYDAAACPFCARVRIVLEEKGIDYETVEIDLRNRPAWIFDLNPHGKVPVLEDGFALPESAVIMEYLEERHPEPPLLPLDHPARARARLAVFRFDDLLGDDYYALRRGEPNALAERLEQLPVGLSLFSDIAYLPWVIRARDRLDVELPAALEEWLERLAARPSVARELEVVAAL